MIKFPRSPRFHRPVASEAIERLLTDVEKPARYTGGELNSIAKPGPVRGRLALCFPDVYEVAESHLGLKVLYHVVNDHQPSEPGALPYAAERVYALWPDLEEKARQARIPLWSLETYRPLAMFDVVGFTLQYELSYPTILAMLDLGGVPLQASGRGALDPVVIGGGAGSFNAEPLADFFDGFLLGDGEDAVLEIMDTVADARARGVDRAILWEELDRIEGLYVPAHYTPRYRGLSVVGIEVQPDKPKAGLITKHRTPRVTRVTVADLDRAPYPTRTIVPNVKPVHDRAAIEIQRGCSQACRFCQAGMITRPTRQRKPATVLKLAEESLRSSGASEVGLLSLSAGDYAPINEVLNEFFKRYREENIGVSLPSMRTETMTPELAEQVATVRKTGFTFAPEAGSERMRKVINKTNTEEDLMNAVRSTVQAGWRHLKFYFMIGLPTETDADVDAIAHVGERALEEGRKIRSDVQVTVSVSTFVPKPHTSFQWERQISVEETRRKHRRLRDRLRRRKIGFRYHSPEQSFLEGVLSRGDRRLGPILEQAFRAGCRLDAWSEHYDESKWLEILRRGLAPHHLAPEDWLAERAEADLLPWDHLDAGILKKFLLRDRHKAYREGTIEDCAFSEHCYACGGCDLGDPYRARPRASGANPSLKLHPTVFSADRNRSGDAPGVEERGGEPAGGTAPSNLRFRTRFQYAKLGRAFHLSHLDVMKHLLRAVRLGELPVRYSEGFSPRPKVAFSPACPTGVASEAEFFDLETDRPVSVRSAAQVLNQYLPEGLHVLNGEALDPGSAAIGQQMISTTYVIARPDHLDRDDFRTRVDAFRGLSARWVRVGRKKRYRFLNARAHVSDVACFGDRVQITLLWNPAGSLKVREAAAVIFDLDRAQLAALRIRKTRVEWGDERAAQPPGEESSPLPVGLEFHDLVTIGDRPPLSPRPRRPSAPAGSSTVPYAE